MTTRIGLDVDGVISAEPRLFSFLSHAIHKAGGEVFILTGDSEVDNKKRLDDWDIKYEALYVAPRPIAKNKAKYAKAVKLDFFLDNRGLNILEVGAVCPVALFMSESEDDLP